MKVIIPGLHNSDEKHWQSILERENPEDYYRVIQEDWNNPICEDWVQTIEDSLKYHDHSELILIGHSIGCMAIAHWYQRFKHKIKGALLVAPSDAESPAYPEYIEGFAPIPLDGLPFKSIVVASTNDHVSSIERIKYFAEAWNSKLIVLKNAGHIESKSGFGSWPLVEQLISELEA
ncbi:MAG: alpha/beta fold hydrolase [Flavobacteriales bacterium]|nr:alpha/beta fold hydrolase [Flavobacteriales bacterium]